MIRKLFSAILVAAIAAIVPAHAGVKVLATTPEWAALTRELGGDKVDVYAATNARSADLIVATGAQLEIGWLPVLLQESGNARIQPGGNGYFEATTALRLLEVPSSVDRSLGDIHPQGNPHAQLDPHNIALVAKSLSTRLATVDAANTAFYQARGADFQTRWQAAIVRWETAAAPLRGVNVVVIHRDQVYLCHWLGLHELAAIEPKPGVPPTAGYLAGLVVKLTSMPPKMILRNAYNDSKAADWLSERIHAPVVTLPYTVGGTPAAKDLFGLFDDTVSRLIGIAR
jgi:zinc/manganese transport system substrate-binding protein